MTAHVYSIASRDRLKHLERTPERDLKSRNLKLADEVARVVRQVAEMENINLSDAFMLIPGVGEVKILDFGGRENGAYHVDIMRKVNEKLERCN